MLVARDQFESILGILLDFRTLSLDTETTGLRPYHGDRLFSLILATVEGEDAPIVSPYYFNFQPYPGLDPKYVLLQEHLEKLKPLFLALDKTWYIHNAKYDLAILANEGIEIAGTVHCTKAIARVEYNEYYGYSLEDCGKRIGYAKDSAVEDYIADHDLWEWKTRPGKKQRTKDKRYDRVPLEVMRPYAERDAEVCGHLGHRQTKTINAVSGDQPEGVPPLSNICDNERRLTKTVFRMEQRGVLIDRNYCERALAYEADRGEKAARAFQSETGKEYRASPLLFKDIFLSERDIWSWGDETATGQINPSFESDALLKFKNPAAKMVLDIRDAKSKADFYAGFLYHSDSRGYVHPNFNPDGTSTGRFSSSEPNLQNLTAEYAATCRTCGEGYEDVAKKCGKCGSNDIDYPEYLVRRAIIPRPGFVFIMPDYDQMEYRMMFDYACGMVGYETALVKKIKYEGLDPHQATADVVTEGGTPLTRKRAKNGNFAVLYGSGYDTLATTIGSTRDEAKALKQNIFKAAPEIKKFVDAVMGAASARGFIRNWAGRRCYFPNSDFAYKAPNYLIQGGCADVNKFALNRIDDYLLDKKSKLVLTIHDENPIEVHESELDHVPGKIKEIMESVYPAKFLPLTAGMEWSAKSLGDKTKGFPCQ